MFIELRKDFDSTTSPFTFRSLLVEAAVPTQYEPLKVRVRCFGGTGFLFIFPEGGTPGSGGIQIGNTLSTESTIGSLMVDPDWADTYRIGRPSSNTGPQTLVMIIE
jgi:hypothetical protein